MKNFNDDECFKWAITRSLNPISKNPQRITKKLRKQARGLNWEGIEFPTPQDPKMYEKFEENNDIDLCILYHETNDVNILYTHERRHSKLVPLFFHKKIPPVNEEKEDVIEIYHYSVIKSISKLLSSQVSKHSHGMHFCHLCLQGFGRKDILDKHLEIFLKNDAVRTILPEKGENILKFRNIRKCSVPSRFLLPLKAY